MYKLFSLLFSSIVFVTGCGENDNKDTKNKNTNNLTITTTNNKTNKTENNGTASATTAAPKPECASNQRKATVNGVTACYHKCLFGNCDLNQTCNKDELCIDDDMTTKTCQTSNDCGDNQSCTNGECATLQFCRSSKNSPTLEGCEHIWRQCLDGKEYRFECVARFNNTPAECECKIDGTLTKSGTSPLNDNTCEYRNVNKICGWSLIP